MSMYYKGDRVTLHHGNCLDVLAELPDCSVDAVVTDPPYGLANTTPEKITETVIRWANGERDYLPGGKGFMGNPWDSFVPPAAVWDDCLRVLKPGGHVLAFAGSRTVDLMTLGLRMGGFEIRDSIAWLYGSGFPKSLDVSKAIDKAGGVSPEVQSQVLRAARVRAGLTRDEVAASVGCTPGSVRDWEEGRARAVGRAVEFITPSEQYRAKLADLLGYTADERRVVGVGGGSRGLYETGHRGIAYGDAHTPEAAEWQGWGTALKPAFEPVVVARKPLAAGTVAGNVLAYGTGALNIDGCRIGYQGDAPTQAEWNAKGSGGNGSAHAGQFSEGLRGAYASGAIPAPSGRWPANVVLDESQAAALDTQTGVTTSRIGKPRGAGSGEGWGMTATGAEYDDTGGASRFFHVAAEDQLDELGSRFKYVAKAPKAERPNVDGVAHSTVKPLALMRWLVRLVTPPGGTVLEPFSGSGTTIEAALLEGFNVIGIEREAEYLPLIEARIARALATETDLFGGAA